MSSEKKNPIVSICCMAYNHAPFIKKCLDGFLMQEPPTGVSADEPWYEILIHDDCSTDGTDDIIREYTEKYPDKIFPLFETENQYSKGKVIDAYNYDRAKGRYIAVCEGDDYWTDPYKLQKQVDWMDAHQDYSVCFHRVKYYNVYTNEYRDDACNQILGDKDGVELTCEMFFHNWYTHPMTELFRVENFDRMLPYKFKYYRDLHEIYYLLKEGKGYIFSFVGGIHIAHHGGVASMISHLEYCDISLPIDREFFWKTRNKWSKKNYIGTLDRCVHTYRCSNKLKAFRYALVRLMITGHIHCFMNQMKLIFGNE